MIVAPHAEYFLGDQIRSLQSHVNGLRVVMPSPYLSGIAVRLPHASRRYASLKRSRISEGGDIKSILIRAKYLGLPGRFARGVTYRLAAGGTIRAVSSSGAEFDVIHSHFLRLHGFIGLKMKAKFGKPLVVTAYGGDAYSLPFLSSFNHRLAVNIIRGADRLIAVSRPIAEILQQLGAEADKVRVIPSGYDSSLFVPMDKSRARAELGLPAEGQIILTVANLVPQKGHTYLLESLRQMVKEGREVRLAIVGEGVLEGELREKTKALGLEDNVVFAGPRPHEEIPRWMSASDVFALPSMNEGSPTVLPEAMACGRPVVATSIGGIPDIVSDAEVGYLVKAGDSDELAGALTRALGREWNDQHIRDYASKFSWDALGSEVAEVYSQASLR